MADKIRVLNLTVGLGLGGAEKIMAHTAARLDKSRFEPEVLALKGPGPSGDILSVAGVPVRTLGARGAWDVFALARAQAILRRGGWDVIHAHLLWANLLACYWKGNARVVWHEHDTDEWMGTHHRLLQVLNIDQADTVVAVSEAVRRRLLHRMPFMDGKVETLLNGWIPSASVIKTDRAAARRDLGAVDGPLVGYVGRLEERKKGLDVFLKAAARFAARVPGARFALVGDGPDRAKLEAQSAALGLKDRVFFAGELADVRDVYAALDLLVLPSRWEGFGLVLLEAMGEGVPVVASSVGGIPEVVRDGETGLLVPPENEAALSAAMERILADPDKRERFGKAGREMVKSRFGLDAYVKRVESLYLRVAGRATS